MARKSATSNRACTYQREQGLLDCNTGMSPTGLPSSEQLAEDIEEDKPKIISLRNILRKVTSKQEVIEIDQNIQELVNRGLTGETENRSNINRACVQLTSNLQSPGTTSSNYGDTRTQQNL